MTPRYRPFRFRVDAGVQHAAYGEPLMDVAWSFITGLGAGYLIVDAITLAITEDSPVLGTIAHWLGIGGDDE